MNKNSNAKILMFIVLCLLFVGCTTNQDDIKVTSNQTNTYNTWCAYWDTSNVVIDTLKSKESTLEIVSYYAAYYNGDILYVPTELEQVFQKTKSYAFKKYITVVDDMENKSSLTKDTIIEQKLRNEETIKEHVKELVSMVKQYQFDGLELDYQSLNDRQKLWPNYISFINKLLAALNKEDKGLRIMISDKTPFKSISLPNGPKYVMRCYDLFHNKTKPGPKADRDYLESIKKQTSSIKNLEYALAIGGYDWGKETVSLTVKEAIQLAKKKRVEIKRDSSGACYYQYSQEKITHTIWYSDEKSIQSWQEMLKTRIVSVWKIET